MFKKPTNPEEKIPDFHRVSEVPADLATKDQLCMLHTRYSLAAKYGVGKDVLEVACGPGLGLGMIAQGARSVVACDIDKQNCAIAMETYKGRPKIAIGRFDAEAVPYPPASFDLIVMFEALYYLKSAEAFFLEVKRLLRPGGKLLISTVNCRWSGFNPSIFSTKYYDAPELASALVRHGFNVSMYAGFPDQKTGPISWAIHALRSAAVSLRLIPDAQKNKQWLKRIFYGRLTPVPRELEWSAAHTTEPDVFAYPYQSDSYRMLYCLASLEDTPSCSPHRDSASYADGGTATTTRGSSGDPLSFRRTDESASPDNQGASNVCPFVSVVMPCYNEREHIGNCLDSILANVYRPDRLEILVIDGMSSDGTREILARYAANHPQLKIIDNPARSKPRAMNLAIQASKGDLILRADCHAVYPPDYIERLVATIQRTGVEGVGAVRETVSSGGVVSQAIAVALSNPFTVGNAHYRSGASAERLVDTIWCGLYRRDVFTRVGEFNEALIRAQDREFNFRLRQEGGKMLLDPSIKASYFPRCVFGPYIKWVYDGAFWLFVAPVYTRVPLLRPRNWAPVLFFSYNIAALLAVSLAPKNSLVFVVPLVFYAVVMAAASIRIAWNRRNPGLAPALLAVMVATHYSYGFGAVRGWLASLFRTRRPALQTEGALKH